MVEDLLAPLAPFDEVKGPPDSRVRSHAGVLSRITEMREAESIRSKRRARQKGLFNGNPPYPPKALRELGRANDTNINLRTSEGIIAAAVTPFYGLVFQVPRAINIQLRYGDDAQRNYEWAETISNGYHEMLKDWRGYNTNIQKKHWQLVVFGVGLPMWEDTYDWHWKSRTVGSVLVGDDAEADVDEVDEICIPRDFLPTRLYKKIKNEASAKVAGWNIEVAKKAIMDAAPGDYRKKWGNNWESYEDSLRCGDVAWNNKASRIFVVDHLVEEYSGKWTHSIVLDDDGLEKGSTLSNQEGEFLFQKKERFESLSEVICPFFFDIVDEGLWHGVKGLAPKIFDFCELENRLTGKTIDQAMAGLIAVPKTADDLRKLETISAGPVTWFPPGTEFQQTKLADNLEGPLMVKRDLKEMLKNNTSVYQQRPYGEDHEPTLGQAQINVQQQALLSEGEVSRYYDCLDLLHRETLRRALKMGLKLYNGKKDTMPDSSTRTKLSPSEKGALKFIEYCVDGDVPLEALEFDNFCRIEAVRAMGYGSPAHRQMISDRLMPMLPMMDEVSRRNAQRQILSPFVGQSQLDAFFPLLNRTQKPYQDEWDAIIENNALRSPEGQWKIEPQQNHFTHFTEHFNDILADIQSLQSGQRHPVDVLIHLHNGGPHLKEHLDAMSGDPTRKDQLQQMGQAWLKLAKVQDQLQQQVTEAAQAAQAQAAQAPQPQVDPEHVKDLLKVRLDAGIKRESAQGKMQMAKEKQEFLLRSKDLMQKHEIELKNRAAAAEIERQNAAAAQKPALAAA